MPRLSAAPIILTPAQADGLQRLARAHKTPRKPVERAEMILRSAAGTGVREIARQLGVWPKTARSWRACWLASAADAPVTGAGVGCCAAGRTGDGHARAGLRHHGTGLRTGGA